MEQITQRFEVISNYPFSPFKIGQIIQQTPPGENTIPLSEILKCPKIFRLLHWYERLKISEMPAYMKSWDKPVNHQSRLSDVVIKSGVDIFWNSNEFGVDDNGFVTSYGGIMLDVFTPATLEDYEAYKAKCNI